MNATKSNEPEMLLCIMCHEQDSYSGFFRTQGRVVCQDCCESFTEEEYQDMVGTLIDGGTL